MQVWFHEVVDGKQSWGRYARLRVCVVFSFELQALEPVGASLVENRFEASEGMVLGGSAVVPKAGIVVTGASVMMVMIVPSSPQLPPHRQLQC